MNIVKIAIYRLLTQFLYKHRFSNIGMKTTIFSPMQLSETKSISIGSRTFIAHYAWLMGNNNVADAVTLSIGNHVQIGHFSHIVGKKNVQIEDSVLIADRVYISDCNHNYNDIARPIFQQGTNFAGDVKIGEGSWIGENVCIIGANAVVTHDIPDYSVAVGIPAKVIKTIKST